MKQHILKNGITQSILPDNRIKLEISNTKVSGKFLNIWRLNNTLLNNTESRGSLRENHNMF